MISLKRSITTSIIVNILNFASPGLGSSLESPQPKPSNESASDKIFAGMELGEYQIFNAQPRLGLRGGYFLGSDLNLITEISSEKGRPFWQNSYDQEGKLEDSRGRVNLGLRWEPLDGSFYFGGGGLWLRRTGWVIGTGEAITASYSNIISEDLGIYGTLGNQWQIFRSGVYLGMQYLTLGWTKPYYRKTTAISELNQNEDDQSRKNLRINMADGYDRLYIEAIKGTIEVRF